MTTEELKNLIVSADAGRLRELWTEYKSKEGFVTEAPAGKSLEFLILRAFELEMKEISELHHKEVGYVKYPFNVPFPQIGSEKCKSTLEQIDGAIAYDGLYSLVEFKDYSDDRISIEPLAKMRNMLERRHGSVFGMFFSTTQYTTPAIAQVQFMAPKIIILWTIEDMDYCMHNRKFIECLKWKYSNAIEQCEYCADYTTHNLLLQQRTCQPLF